MKKILSIFACLLIIFGVLNLNTPAEAAGAFFFLSPATGTKAIDTLFNVVIKINTGEAVINAAEGTLNFDTNKLEVSSLSKSGSALNLWTTEPVFNNSAGTIIFAGGMPRPGFSGKSGTVLTIVFKAKAAGEAQINFSSGAILANDGSGTNVLTSMGSANFTISPKTDTSKTDEVNNIDNSQSFASSTEPAPVLISQSTINNSIGIISATHPNSDIWSSQNNAEFKWSNPDGALYMSTAFNNNPNFDPGDQKETLVSSKRFESIKDGVWFFHLKIKVGKDWTPVSHYKIQIDATPPLPFIINVEQKQTQDLPVLYFKAADGTSGIVRYEVNIGSLEEKGFMVDSKESMLKVPSLEVGPHTAMVKAIDGAGNQVISTIEFVITPIETPVIKNYSAEIKPSDKFFISGTALSNVDINVYLQREDGKVTIKKTTSDKNGLWYLITDSGLLDGQYVAWVEATNANGLRSEPSPKVSFLVSPPIFAKIGTFVINYFTMFASLLFMVILIVASILFLTHIIKKRLKKETFEVEEVLHANMESLKELIDNEMVRLGRLQSKESISKEKARLKQSLKEKIEVTEKKIMKEIKDVEKLLK